MDFGMTSVVGITVLCYLAAMGIKATTLDHKWVPFICGILGGVLGIVGMFLIPDYPAQDLITAAAVGVVSGFAATGVHQMYKQMKTGKEESGNG